MSVCIYVCMYICMYVCMYICMYVCMYVCMCVCIVSCWVVSVVLEYSPSRRPPRGSHLSKPCRYVTSDESPRVKRNRVRHKPSRIKYRLSQYSFFFRDQMSHTSRIVFHALSRFPSWHRIALIYRATAATYSTRKQCSPTRTIPSP